MSLCYEGEKWLMITFASVAISLTVGLGLMQYAYGQVENNSTVGKSMVDKLIEDTKKNQAISESYGEELARYIVSHNMSILHADSLPNSESEAQAGPWELLPLEELRTWDIDLLESTAKTHMQACENCGNQSVIYYEYTRKGDCDK